MMKFCSNVFARSPTLHPVLTRHASAYLYNAIPNGMFIKSAYRHQKVDICQFLAEPTVNNRAYATVLCPSVCRLSIVCNACIVAKRCVLELKLLLTTYRKSHIGNRLVPK